MAQQLVLAGGGHAHLYTLSRLRQFTDAGISVTCVAPGPWLAYSGMGPGLLAGRYALDDVRFPIEAMLRGPDVDRSGALSSPGCAPVASSSDDLTRFVRASVTGIDPKARSLTLNDGRRIAYDAVSFGIGSLVPTPFPTDVGSVVFPVKPIENLLTARQAIEARLETGLSAQVLVAGGGPSAVEVAGNVLGLFARRGVPHGQMVVAAAHGLLPGWPRRARRLAVQSLARRGARILETRVTGVADGRARLENGGRLDCDVVLVATGTRPPDLFARCGLQTADTGGLAVNAFLQSPFFPEIFGGGDCIHFGPTPLPRAGVYAVRQGPVLCANLLARLTGRPLTPFRKTGTRYLAILNTGDGRAIARKGPFVGAGRWALALKDRIDRRFMRTFQLPPPPGLV